MPPVRILIVLTYYLPHRTGLTLHVQRVAEELVRRGHEVTVLSARFRPDLPAREVIGGVTVERLWAPVRISRGMVMPGFPFHLARLAARHNLVWLSTPILESALVAVLLNAMNKPLVITHHGDLILPRGLVNRLIQRLVFLQYGIAARYASRIVGYSHDYADHSYYLRPYRAKSTIIYPPIQMPAPNAEAVAELRRSWGVTDGYAVGYAGRFVEEKRPDVLIRSLASLNQHLPGAKIVFAGEYLMPYENFFERCRRAGGSPPGSAHLPGLVGQPAGDGELLRGLRCPRLAERHRMPRLRADRGDALRHPGRGHRHAGRAGGGTRDRHGALGADGPPGSPGRSFGRGDG